MRVPSVLKELYSSGDDHFLEIVRHTFWALVLLVGTTAIQFLFDVLLSREFGAHGAGTFYLALSVTMVLALLGRLGMDRSVVRFIPPLVPSDPGAAAGVNRVAIQLSLLLTVPLAVVVLVAAPWLATDVFGSDELTVHLRILALAIPPLALNYILSGTLRALKHTRLALSIERLTMYSLGIVGILVLGRVYGLEFVTAGFAAAIYVTTVEGMWYVKRRFPPHTSVRLFSRRRMLITSAPLLLVVFTTQLNGQVSVLMLGGYADNSDVGVFNIALKVSLLMGLVLAAINTISATKISELYAAGRREELGRTIGKISGLGVVTGLPILALLVLLPDVWLGLFGPEFTTGAPDLVILAVGQFVNVATGSTLFILAMTGHERALAGAVGLSLLVNIGLGLLLIPLYTVIGASIATSVSLVVVNVAMILMVRHYLGVWSLPGGAILSWARTLTTGARE